MEAGEILVRRGLIDPDQLEKSRQGVGEGTNVVNVAIELGYVDEEVALRAMAEEVGLDFVDLTQTDVDLTLLETFPTKLIYRQNLFPVARSNGQLEVATSDRCPSMPATDQCGHVPIRGCAVTQGASDIVPPTVCFACCRHTAAVLVAAID